MRNAFVAIAAMLAACSSPGSPKSCIQGASIACTCANGESGAQVCGSDGTLAPCSCQGSTGTGGSGAGAGTGGMTATGGGPGSGGTGSGGTSGGQTTTGQFTVTYDGSLTKNLSTCGTCLGSYSAPTNSSGAEFVFTVDSGMTTVSMTIMPASSGGNQFSLALLESSPAVPADLRAEYVTTPAYVPLAGACATFTTLTLGQGGMMAGSLNCTLTSETTTPHTAILQGTFAATFE
jgi:hypothetical protein